MFYVSGFPAVFFYAPLTVFICQTWRKAQCLQRYGAGMDEKYEANLAQSQQHRGRLLHWNSRTLKPLNRIKKDS